MIFHNTSFIRKSCLITVLMLAFSCGTKNSTSNKGTIDTISTEGMNNAYLESVYYRFPTPDEVFKFINNEKLKFNPSLLNEVSKIDTYLDIKSQTTALGVYIADLAYVTMFEAYNKSADYYKAVHELSSKIRISSAYDLEVAQRIEKNLLNIDSLKSISIDSYSSMVEFLVLNNREKTLALIAAGSYIECFHLVFSLAGKYSKNNTMIVKIADLKYAFDNLYSYLLIFSDDKGIKELSEQLQPLSELFSKIEQKDLGKTTVTQTKDGDIVLGGGTKLSFTPELFEQMKKEVERLRNLLVNPK